MTYLRSVTGLALLSCMASAGAHPGHSTLAHAHVHGDLLLAIGASAVLVALAGAALYRSAVFRTEK